MDEREISMHVASVMFVRPENKQSGVKLGGSRQIDPEAAKEARVVGIRFHPD